MADLKRKRSTSPNAVDDIATKKAKTKTPYTSTRKKAPGFSNKIFNETSYYIRNGTCMAYIMAARTACVNHHSVHVIYNNIIHTH